MAERIEKDLLYHAIRSLTTRALLDRLSCDREQLFQKMSSADFMFMVVVVNHPGRMYINDLAQQMQLPIRKISEMAQTLAAQDLIRWEFEGNGDQGTYVVPTKMGKKATQDQIDILEGYYTKVIQRYGKDRFKGLVKNLNELESIMAKGILELEEEK